MLTLIAALHITPPFSIAESKEGPVDEEADQRAMSAIAQALVAARPTLQG